MVEPRFARARRHAQHACAQTTHTPPTQHKHARAGARARARTHAHSRSYVRCNRVNTVPTQVQVLSRMQARVDTSTRACAQTLRARMRNRSQPHPRRISSVGLMYDPGQLTLLQSNRHSSCTRSSSSRRRRRMSSGCSFSSLVTRQVGGGQGWGRVKKGGGRRRRGREEERFEGGTFLEGNLLP